LPTPDSQPRQWRINGEPRPIGGATVGALWFGHEQSTNTAWLDSTAVPLDTNNTLLVEIDALGKPQVVGQARIETRLPPPEGCDRVSHETRHQLFEEALWSRLRNVPHARAFVSR